MTTGIVFDIKEFAVHDGPGIRTTVFLKGCPLRCRWCHNPEGQSPLPQTIQGSAGPRVAGRTYTAEALARLLNEQAEILRDCEGGVTFSGGEPLFQADFVVAVARRLKGIHCLLQTSGYGSEEMFRRVLARMDMVFFDLKLMDKDAHRRYTGASNELILRNLHTVSESALPYVVRVPLVPGVTDSDENLAAIAAVVRGLRPPLRIDLLPYNPVTGGKYAAAGMAFRPGYDETRPPNLNRNIFEPTGVEVQVA